MFCMTLGLLRITLCVFEKGERNREMEKEKKSGIWIEKMREKVIEKKRQCDLRAN
jgi:hypothetical protein